MMVAPPTGTLKLIIGTMEGCSRFQRCMEHTPRYIMCFFLIAAGLNFNNAAAGIYLPMTKRRVKNAISIMWLFYTETEDQINIFNAILSVYSSFTSIRIAFAPDRTSAARMLF